MGKSRTAGRSTALSINDLSLYIFSFLTSEYTLPPGVIAHLCRLRWEIEKTFDELKNKLG